MAKWTATDIPDQTGRVVIITGANSGLGYESALALARKGATVVMACRNAVQGQQALNRIKQAVPNAKLELASLDLSGLASVRAFGDSFKASHDRLDVLMNNAGVMAIPRRETKDGFEMQLGVNHLGHFALTGLLLDLLLKTPRSRVVSTSSGLYVLGQLNLDDLQMKNKYKAWDSYGRSKLSNLLFAFELQRRLKAAGADVISLVAHPGFASTNLQGTSASASSNPITKFLTPIGNAVFAQSATMGALPQLYAATASDAQGGQYYGPDFLDWRGYPKLTHANAKANDPETARRLWEASEKLTQTHYDFVKSSPAQV